MERGPDEPISRNLPYYQGLKIRQDRYQLSHADSNINRDGFERTLRFPGLSPCLRAADSSPFPDRRHTSEGNVHPLVRQTLIKLFTETNGKRTTDSLAMFGEFTT